MAQLNKTEAKIGGVTLSANESVVWRLTTGVQPYTTALSCSAEDWEQTLKGQMGQDLTLTLKSGNNGQTYTIGNVTILHELGRASRHRAVFVVADRRWKWRYTIFRRDFNMIKKTGNKTAIFENVPTALTQYIDTYRYRDYSLDQDTQGQKTTWTTRRALESVLDDIVEGQYDFESWPVTDDGGSEEFKIQNLSIRDSADGAIGRLLSYVPGANLYIGLDGRVKLYNAADNAEMLEVFNGLPHQTKLGHYGVEIDKKAIRPKKVYVYYEREVECLLDFDDDTPESTYVQPDRTTPYVENVCQTVDEQLPIYEYDPITNTYAQRTPAPGTWVTFSEFLLACNNAQRSDANPWTWDTLKVHYMLGSLLGSLAPGAADGVAAGDDEFISIAERVNQIESNFRRTFRINRLLTSKVERWLPVRSAMFDPMTGARAQACVWGQYCYMPTTKQRMIYPTQDEDKKGLYVNVDTYGRSQREGKKFIELAPSPARVQFVDEQEGVFRVDWIKQPYGLQESMIPSLVVTAADTSSLKPQTADLAKQDDELLVAGAKRQGSNNYGILKSECRFKAMVSFIPAAPNNKSKLYRVEVTPEDVTSFMNGDVKIENGDGPPLEMYVSPGELTARFAWTDDAAAQSTLSRWLELSGQQSGGGGTPAGEAEPEFNELEGFTLVNEESHLTIHAQSVAAEAYMAFADTLHGEIVADAQSAAGLKLAGNMTAASITLGQAPSASMMQRLSFPGTRRPLSRFALMGDVARQFVVKTIE
jgi:hypothetical protein